MKGVTNEEHFVFYILGDHEYMGWQRVELGNGFDYYHPRHTWLTRSREEVKE